MPGHEERPPTTLAQGAVKSDDIERVRRNLDEAQERAAQAQKTSAARKQRALRRKTKRKQDAQP